VFTVCMPPRSGRDEVVGWQEGELRVRMRAAPVEGQANEAICRLIAKHAGVAYSTVEVVSGETSRTKTVRITGSGENDARTRLSGA
jgi:uncharacterized protein (TIGR00251 family)